ncbi:MAG: hypothetical protein KDJ80_03755 [Nitratireductor sp.]|nr:hypothetical protein [Nitratireductor sp.]
MAGSFRSSASFGKRQEFGAIAELLRRGYDVYLTLVDDQGIDCIVRQDADTYFDVQIKARSREVNPRNAGFFPTLPIPELRDNYIFILYAEAAEHPNGGSQGVYWVIPSKEIAEHGGSLKSGPGKGAFRLWLTLHSQKTGLVTVRPKYRKFIDAFEEAFGTPPAKRK